MRKKIAFLILFLLFTIPAAAQVLLTATTDKTALTLDDELTLTVRLSGTKGNLIMPQLPSLPAFNVYSRQVNQSSINGNNTLLFRYTLLPRFVGKTTIGPVTFNYEGNTYKTEPIQIRIYRDSSAVQNTPIQSVSPDGNISSNQEQEISANLPPLEYSLATQASKHREPFFTIAAVSNQNPYVNQEFTLAIRFYYSQAFYDAPYQKPTVSNLFLEDAGSVDGTQSINGVLYRYQEQRYLLMGAAPGPATIGSATVTYHVSMSPLSALDRFFGSAMREERKSVSSPISVNIRQLPSGQPASFYGAVGQGYTFHASVQPAKVEAGEAVNLTATVRGPINLKSTRDFPFPNIDGFKSYPAAAVSGNIPGANNTIQSYKTFKTVLVPVASGIYTIPPLEWSYFHPGKNQYLTLTTQPLSITVTPSTQTEKSFDFAANHTIGSGFQTLGQDVRYLKTSYAPKELWLAQLSQWKIINALMLGLVACCVLFASFGRKSLSQRKAFTTARTKLKKAQAETEVAEAVATYLQEKLRINTGSLPLKEITTALAKKGVRPATAEAFSLLWQRLDAARFAPAELGAQSTMDLSAQALDVLVLIEEETK